MRAGQRSRTNDHEVARRDTSKIHVPDSTLGGTILFSARLEVQLIDLVSFPQSLAACNLPLYGIGFDKAPASASISCGNPLATADHCSEASMPVG